MDPQQAIQLKKTLLEERAKIEAQLELIAKRNPAIKGDWTANQYDENGISDTLD